MKALTISPPFGHRRAFDLERADQMADRPDDILGPSEERETAVNGGKTVLTSTPREIFASTDGGESWRGLGVGRYFRLPYCRSLALKADDPGVVFVATGDGALGSTGAIQRSSDGGQSWQMLPLPVEPNSPIWTFATHHVDPKRILACSHYGEVFASRDTGDSWTKLHREFSEIRALAWTPN
jgi:photosystem II stability/assembly factor-like uncharacterized protein